MQWIRKNKDIKFKKKKILVIGELIIDRSYNLSHIGESLETKNPKYFINNVKDELGGAGKVYQSLKTLIKNHSMFITSKYQKSEIIKDKNIFYFNSKIINIIKNRYWENKKKLFQLNCDYKKKYLEKISFTNFALKKIKKNIDIIDSIIIADYNHGLINNIMVTQIKKICKSKEIDIYVDKQIRNASEFSKYYFDLDYLVINQLEFKLLKGKFKINGNIFNCLKKLKTKIKFKNIILKKGEKGSCMVNEKNKYFVSKNNSSKKVINTSGAGDHFLAMFVALKNNLEPEKRLMLSNQWAKYNLK